MTWMDFLVKLPGLFLFSKKKKKTSLIWLGGIFWWSFHHFLHILELDEMTLTANSMELDFLFYLIVVILVLDLWPYSTSPMYSGLLWFLLIKYCVTYQKKKHVEWKGFKLLLYIISFCTLADSESTGSALEVIKGEWGRTLTSRQKRKVHQMNLKYFITTGTDMALNETRPLIPISSSFPFVLRLYNSRYNKPLPPPQLLTWARKKKFLYGSTLHLLNYLA